MAFKYIKRTAADIEKRAAQQGSEYDGFIKDEYQTYPVKAGDNLIRILPPTWEGARHYAFDLYVHYNIGPTRGAVVCNLSQYKTPCPICEERARLVTRLGDKDEEVINLRTVKRALMWVWDKKDTAKGCQVWGAPWTCDRDLAVITKDKATGEIYYIDDPDEGYDVSFEKTGKGQQTKYVGWQLSRKASSIPDEILNYVEDHPLPDTIRDRTYEEVAKLFSGGREHEEEDPMPRRVRQAMEEERPITRSRRAEPETGDTTPPPRRRAVQVEDDEEAPPARKTLARSRPSAPIEDDEPAPPPRRRARAAEIEDDVEEAEEQIKPTPRQRLRNPEPKEEPAPPARRRAIAREVEEDEEPAPPALRKRAVVQEPDPKQKMTMFRQPDSHYVTD